MELYKKLLLGVLIGLVITFVYSVWPSSAACTENCPTATCLRGDSCGDGCFCNHRTHWCEPAW